MAARDPQSPRSNWLSRTAALSRLRVTCWVWCRRVAADGPPAAATVVTFFTFLPSFVFILAGGPLPGVMRLSDEHSLRRDWDRDVLGCV